jgi:hypothetical protein
MPGFVPRFSGVVDTSGRVRFDNRSAFDSYCANFATKHVEISIRPWQKKRTIAQNKAWWKLAMGALSEWNGEEAEDWHKRVKRQFGIASTAGLTVSEFEELREKTIRWAAQTYGVVIPDPNEVSL